MALYQNPALDLARVGLPLAYTAAKTAYEHRDTLSKLYDYMRSYNKSSSTQKRKRPVANKALVVPLKTRTTNRIGQFRNSNPRDFQEKRWVDVFNSAAFSNTAVQQLLNGFQVNTDYYNRLGHNYLNKKLTFECWVMPNQTTCTTFDVGCIVLVWDRQTNGAAPGFSSVLQSTQNSGVQTASSRSFFNKEQSERFLILRHEKIMLPTYALTGSQVTTPAFYDGQQKYHFKWNIPLNLQTKCSGDGALVTDILAGSLYLMVASESATAGWTLKYHSRVTIDC